MPESSLAPLISQGGFAVLAGFAVLTIWQMAKAWVSDVKANAERERLLSREVISALLDVTKTLAANTAAVAVVGNEVAGLRTGIHGIRDLMGTFESRFFELEKQRG